MSQSRKQGPRMGQSTGRFNNNSSSRNEGTPQVTAPERLLEKRRTKKGSEERERRRSEVRRGRERAIIWRRGAGTERSEVRSGGPTWAGTAIFFLLLSVSPHSAILTSFSEKAGRLASLARPRTVDDLPSHPSFPCWSACPEFFFYLFFFSIFIS